MLAEIGLIALFAAFLAAIYAIVASLYGERFRSEKFLLMGRNAALVTFPLILLANLALVIALLSEQYQISYVFNVTDPDTPQIFRLTALWGSQKGSLLFWSLLMSLFCFAAILINWRNERRLMPFAIVFMMATLAFFIGLSLFLENPFERFWIQPELPENEQVTQSVLIPPNAFAPPQENMAQNARGLNPLLRHFGMVIHPPVLYLGFVGLVVPFAFAMAALATGELSTNWIKLSRRWSLIAWLFLSLGLILGGRWAYDVLGWGGYWGWDPVENAAFLPWLVTTAFIHSVMIQQKRGMLKVWNMFLIIFAYSAMMFGTFATRSGIIESVHSFARSEIGFPMLVFWSGITIVGVGMTLWRWNHGQLKDERAFTGILSRESLFVLNNVIFMALTIAIFWGSFGAPILSSLFLDTQLTLGIDYFMVVTPPLFAAMYILMGIAPLSAWGATSAKRLGNALTIPVLMTTLTLTGAFILGTRTPVALVAYGIVLFAGFVALHEIYRGAKARRTGHSESWGEALLTLFTRNQRRYGGYIVHLGITIIGIGVIGSTLFQTETQRTLALGESLRIQNYELRFDDFVRAEAVDNRVMNIASMSLFRDNRQITRIRPRIDQYPGNEANTMTIAGAHSTVENDFYVLLVGEQNGIASFKVYINPLVNLVWWGGLVLIFGTFIAAWPRETVPERIRNFERKPFPLDRSQRAKV